MTFSEAVGKLVWSFKWFLSGLVFGGVAWALLSQPTSVTGPAPNSYLSAGYVLAALSFVFFFISCWWIIKPLVSRITKSFKRSNNGTLNYEEIKDNESREYRGVDVSGSVVSVFGVIPGF